MDLLTRKESSFVLWQCGPQAVAPQLVIGKLQPGNPPAFTGGQRFPLSPDTVLPDLWTLDASACLLGENEVYHYWFEVEDTHPKRAPGTRILICDPTALVVDWRLLGPKPPGPYGDDSRAPAAVIKHAGGKLLVADPGGELPAGNDLAPLSSLAPNSRLVIYEMPTAWSRIASDGTKESGVGSFRDVMALLDRAEEGANFSDLDVAQPNRAYLVELGINALELLPPADSFYERTWGYGTTNYLAADYELGFPLGNASPTAASDLDALVTLCHKHGVRFFVDVVMGFARASPYAAANCPDFFILEPWKEPLNPDAFKSRPGRFREDFGSNLFRYAKFVNGYEPVSGSSVSFSPGRQLMKTALLRWMRDFRVDGIRMDSVENVSNWDFVGEYKDLARTTWTDRAKASGLSDAGASERFLVVGEELEEPMALLSQKRLDGLWREQFKKFIRHALLGRNADGEPSFEWTVRRAIDCRHGGYTDLSQAIIYLTSHDVGGDENERLYNHFKRNGVFPAEPRIKLGFACLLTAVGIPMILAGDEFADEHDRFDAGGHVSEEGGKQVDPVNYSRLSDDWRTKIKDYVSRLVHFRTSYDALAVNDTDFIHIDFDGGKRVLVWRRGRAGSDSQVVVVANFSDYGTPHALSPGAEYVVHGWPATPAGKQWKEVTRDRIVPPGEVGREPIFPWEAKVYALV